VAAVRFPATTSEHKSSIRLRLVRWLFIRVSFGCPVGEPAYFAVFVDNYAYVVLI
jgi:hypothetical protein